MGLGSRTAALLGWTEGQVSRSPTPHPPTRAHPHTPAGLRARAMGVQTLECQFRLCPGHLCLDVGLAQKAQEGQRGKPSPGTVIYTVIYVIGLVLETRPQARPGPDASHASLGLPKQDVVSTLNRQGN